MQEKFTFNLETPKFKKKMILFKEDLESREHVVLKLLGYILFYEEDLKIEVSIGTHYKPDLVVEDRPGIPKVWIDCGKITLKKIETIAGKYKRAKFYILKCLKHEAEMFRKQAGKRIEDMANITFIHFDRGFVEGIAAHLNRSNDLVMWHVDENTVGIALGDHVFESAVFYL
jgi:uncharacterized protein YaeQ